MNIADNPTPLDVLLEAMMDKYRVGDLDSAANYARLAAPYCHARKVPTPRAAPPTIEARNLADAELDRLDPCFDLRARATDPPADPHRPA
jgi:hypothetical protein